MLRERDELVVELNRPAHRVMAQNPGGETDGTDLAASESFFENWEHDYPCFRTNRDYPLAAPMCDLLSQVLVTRSVDAIRQVPASNVVFRRSRKTETLNVSLSSAADEARPFVRELLQIVDPRCILLISSKAYELFVSYHCRADSVIPNDDPMIYTPNGRRPACIFRRARGFVDALRREVPLFMVGHPSKYSGRSEWRSVVANVHAELDQLGLAPIERTSALVPVPPLPAYGTTL